MIWMVLLWLPISTTGQGQPNFQNAEARKTMSLDGRWQIMVDPLENGYYNHRYQEKPDGYFLNRKMASPSDLIEYNFDEGKELQVPGDWNTQSEKLYYYEGTLWYKRSFDYPVNPGSRVFVHFGAVNYEAVVYLNGVKLGTHTGGYTPFQFEVTGTVREKDNFLVVKVNNTRRREGVPTLNMDWWNYGGITRSVFLFETKGVFVQDYFIHLNNQNPGEINGWVQLSDPGPDREVKLMIPELNIDRIFVTDPSGRAEISLGARPLLWSPEKPKTYEIRLSAAEDFISDRVGFRTIETRGHQILLNGEAIFLKGICIHAEAPFGPGRVTTREECEVLLGWARELGCNFVRLAHYPHSREMVRAAERMGLLVWSEIPVYWTVMFENPGTYENASRQLEEMISRDRNRANIILWSVANETPPGESRNHFLSGLASRAKQLDPTRLTAAALDTHTSREGVQAIEDELGNYIDVIGINQYCGWYAGKPGDCSGMQWEMEYDKPLIISEMGGGALQGYHGGADERWTEEYQDAVYSNNLKMLDQIDFLAGMSPWILNDFLSPRRQLDRIQNDYNRKGLISERGIRKKAFFTLQEYYLRK